MPLSPVRYCVFLAIGFCLALPVALVAHHAPPFRQYSPENGLPSSEVYVSLQDNEGNIWFGTDRGLARFDGYAFQTYSSRDGLLDNTIFKLQQGVGKIWMITYTGRIFYFKNGKIYPYRFNETLMEITQSRMPLGFYVDSLENVSVSIRDVGILRIDTAGKREWKYSLHTHTGISHVIDYGSPVIIPAVIHPEEVVKNINLLLTANQQTDTFSLVTLSSDRLSAQRMGKDLYFNIGRIIYRYSDNRISVHHQLPDKILHLYCDRQNTLWAGTEDGVFSINKSGHRKLLENSAVTSTMQDAEGGYWFSTLNNGVFYQPGYGVEGIRFTGYFQKPISLCNNGGNAVIAGCWNGSLIELKDGFLRSIYSPPFEDGKPVTELTRLPPDRRIFISQTNPAFMIDGKVKRFLYKGDIGIKTNFLKLSDGNIYCAGSVLLFKLVGDSLVLIGNSPQKINCMIEYSDGNLLTGSNRGVYVYNLLTGKSSLFRRELEHIRVDDMQWLNDRLLIATKGEGLLVLANDTLLRIDAAKGLCSDLLNKILVTDDAVWVSSNKGISRITFDKNSNFSITNIRTIEGLYSDEINDIGLFNDTIYVATNAGISFFPANTDFINSHNPEVYISSLAINNNDTVLVNEMDFKFHENFIRIRFNGVSFRSNGNLTYRYELASSSDTIRSLTQSRQVEFLSLRPGDYRFSVSAMNSSGVWSVIPAVFSFTIKPAWYNTSAFRVLLAVLFTAAFYYFYRSRTSRIRKSYEIERRQASLQLTALRSQMNPHFIFNVMNSIRNYMQNNDTKSAEKYLTSFSRLVRYTLDNSDVQEVSLEDELNALKSYTELEMQRFEKGFDFNIDCDKDIDLKETMLPSLLLQPFVENAIKHGISAIEERGIISIVIRKSQDAILISITDNGKGIKSGGENRNNGHVSHGSFIAFERIKAYNKAYGRNISARVTTGDKASATRAGTKVEVLIG